MRLDEAAVVLQENGYKISLLKNQAGSTLEVHVYEIGMLLQKTMKRIRDLLDKYDLVIWCNPNSETVFIK